jgi:hypothetical protein
MRKGLARIAFLGLADAGCGGGSGNESTPEASGALQAGGITGVRTRHNQTGGWYEGDENFDGIVDWRVVFDRAVDANDRPTETSQESDMNADGIVDTRSRESWTTVSPARRCTKISTTRTPTAWWKSTSSPTTASETG